MAEKEFYTVNAEPSYAFYSRYSEGWDKPGPVEVYHLACPRCQAEEIVLLKESDGAAHMLGDRAQCWMCKTEFTVTENCWKRKIKN